MNENRRVRNPIIDKILSETTEEEKRKIEMRMRMQNIEEKMYQIAVHKTPIYNKTYLVTGGAGFIGSNTVKYLLKHGAKVKVMDDFSTGKHDNLPDHPNLQVFNADILDKEACLYYTFGVNAVLHLAAIGSVPLSLIDPKKTMQVNVEGFLNVMEACKVNGVKRFVYASSSAVYGDDNATEKFEKITGRQQSPYAASKYSDEHFASSFNQCFGLETIGLRYFNVFGPNQDPNGAYAAVIPIFVKAILDNKAPYINGDGQATRDFVFIEDVVQANVIALTTTEEKTFGDNFNVGTGSKLTINRLFNEIAKYMESDLKPLYREERKGDIKHSLSNLTRAKGILGYVPNFRFSEGLPFTVEYFKELNEMNTNL